MDNKTQRRPLLDPLLLLLKSRRVLIALSTLLVAFSVIAIPQLATVQSELLVLVTALALALIGGLSLEDAVHAARQVKPADHLERLVDEAAYSIPGEILSVDEIEDES